MYNDVIPITAKTFAESCKTSVKDLNMNFYTSIIILISGITLFDLSCVWQNKERFISDKYRDFLLKHYEIKPGSSDDNFLRNMAKDIRIDVVFICNKKILKDYLSDKLITKSNEVYSKCLDNTDCFFVKMSNDGNPMSFGSYRIIFNISKEQRIAEIEDYYFYPPVSCKLKCLEAAIEEIENHIDLPAHCEDLKIGVYLYTDSAKNIMKYYDNYLTNENFPPEIIDR